MPGSSIRRPISTSSAIFLIADGVIREAKKGIGAGGVPEGTDVIDCRGKLIAPGLVDMRAFIGEPGAGHRETFASASQAAAAGGVTTIICQPDTSPVIDDPATVDFVLRRARDNRDRPRASDGGADQGSARQGNDGSRPAEGCRAPSPSPTAKGASPMRK